MLLDEFRQEKFTRRPPSSSESEDTDEETYSKKSEDEGKEKGKGENKPKVKTPKPKSEGKVKKECYKPTEHDGLKKDGTPDMRIKENRDAAKKAQKGSKEESKEAPPSKKVETTKSVKTPLPTTNPFVPPKQVSQGPDIRPPVNKNVMNNTSTTYSNTSSYSQSKPSTSSYVAASSSGPRKADGTLDMRYT